MAIFHVLSAVLSLTAFAGSVSERGASAWSRCASGLMAVAMIGAVVPGLQVVPEVVWCAALIVLALASAFFQRRAGIEGRHALRTPLSAVVMAVLVVAAGEGHGASSEAGHTHHDGTSLVAIVVLAAATQIVLCLDEVRRHRGGVALIRGRDRGAQLFRAGSMAGAALAMAAAVVLAG